MTNKVMIVKRQSFPQVLLGLVSLLAIFEDVIVVIAHVSLTYPPARMYDFDFLDNIRTKPPCGMPKGKIRTTLIAGAPTNITWHLAYPHQGGYRLELLDRKEKLMWNLTSGRHSEDYVQGDPTAQWHTITLPRDMNCEGCTIRLLRQANEWANSYRFWSCADVDIVSHRNYKEDCFSNGRPAGGGCVCKPGYWGPRCQFWDECMSDKDCGGSGKCIDLGGTSLPQKQCFCPSGYRGERCDKRNSDKLPGRKTLDLRSHVRQELSDRMNLYYKTIPAAREADREIEFVLIINGTSYGAIGWRPATLNKTCKMWPQVNDPEQQGDNPLRSIRQTGGSKMHKPNPTLLRPLSPQQRSFPDPESTPREQGGRFSKPSNENLKQDRMGSLAVSEPKAEAEPEPEKVRGLPKSQPETEHQPEKSVAEPHPGNTGPKPKPGKAVPEPEPEKSSAEPEPEKSSAEPEKSSAEPEPEKFSAEPKSEKSSAEPEPEKSSAEPEPEKSSAEPEPEKSSAEPEPEKSSAEPEPEKSSAEPEPEKSSAEPEPEKSSVEPEPEKSSAEPEPEKSSVEPEPEKSSAEPEPEKSSPEPENSHPEPEPEKPSAEPEPEQPAVPESTSEPQSKPETHPEPSPETEPTSEPEITPSHPKSTKKSSSGVNPKVEPEPESSASEPEPEPQDGSNPDLYNKDRKANSYSLKGDFHAMDCTDIIMGTARGEYSRIRDYYTRDRSTPRLDTYFGGTDGLTSATGWEEGGVTTLIFRRKVISLENTDHSIKGSMLVIWARGQQHGNYIHVPKSGLEVESPSVPNFYAEDEIKYHGRGGQRGVTYITFE